MYYHIRATKTKYLTLHNKINKHNVVEKHSKPQTVWLNDLQNKKKSSFFPVVTPHKYLLAQKNHFFIDESAEIFAMCVTVETKQQKKKLTALYSPLNKYANMMSLNCWGMKVTEFCRCPKSTLKAGIRVGNWGNANGLWVQLDAPNFWWSISHSLHGIFNFIFASEH